MKHDLSSIRLLGTVGEPINPKAWLWYWKVIGGGNCPVVDTWWQTETGQIMITTLPGAQDHLPTGGRCRFMAIATAEAEADFNTAVSLGEGGRASEAKPILVSLTERYPDEPRYWRILAQTCFAAQVPEEATICLAALERLEPNRPQTLALRGILAWTRGDMKECAEAFTASEKIAPDDPVTQNYLGTPLSPPAALAGSGASFSPGAGNRSRFSGCTLRIERRVASPESGRTRNRTRLDGGRIAPRFSGSAFSAWRGSFAARLV